MSEERRGRLYGRRWKILIYKPEYKNVKITNLAGGGTITTKELDPNYSSAIDVSLLKCVFKINETIDTAAAICTLEVYNMNSTTEGDIIREGFQISIEGGYDEGQYGELFTGDIVQVIRNREDGINYKLEILALRGSKIFDLSFIKSSVAAGSQPRDIINTIAKQSTNPFVVDEISNNLSQARLPRGKVLFGTPNQYLRSLCLGNDAYYWTGTDGQVKVKKLSDSIPQDQVLVLSPGNPNANAPATGLVGTPQYSDDGIHISMLLDCRVKLFSLIQIDNEWIRKSLINFNPNGGKNNTLAQQNQFDKDGEYQVFKLTHKGDTWGDTWVTEVIGIGRNGRGGLLISQEKPTQTPR